MLLLVIILWRNVQQTSIVLSYVNIWQGISFLIKPIIVKDFDIFNNLTLGMLATKLKLFVKQAHIALKLLLNNWCKLKIYEQINGNNRK